MKWKWPFGIKARDTKAAWPLALLSEPRAANWGARDAGALIPDEHCPPSIAA